MSRVCITAEKKQLGYKNIAITYRCGNIIWIGATSPGSVHDKKLADAAPLKYFRAEFWGDLGFQGLQKVLELVRLPHKKPRNGQLTDEQKLENLAFSRLRIRIEHIFASVKVCESLKKSAVAKSLGYDIHSSELHVRCTISELSRLKSCVHKL